MKSTVTVTAKTNNTDMSSYRQILYHIVFCTKKRRKTINANHSRELYAYIYGIIRNKNCFLYRINGIEDHLHILCNLHPSIALADFMRDIKASSSLWLKQSGKFPGFRGWADGYAAFTCGWKDKDRIVRYIKNQQVHHRRASSREELRTLLHEQGVDFDEMYFL
jgi:putative transposase